MKQEGKELQFHKHFEETLRITNYVFMFVTIFVFFIIPIYGIISLGITLGIFIGRRLLQDDLEAGVEKYKIRKVTNCLECEGSGYSRDYMNACSYNLSDKGIEKTCHVCGGSGKNEKVDLNNCNLCQDSGMIWSGKRKTKYRCILKRLGERT